MRLWSIHPGTLDPQGLNALWREALGAQKAIRATLNGEKCGYQHHPQLKRWLAADDPLAAIGCYLLSIQTEGGYWRGYNYNAALILAPNREIRMFVTDGQLGWEHNHIMQKLAVRSPEWYEDRKHWTPSANSMFLVVPGPIADWERGSESEEFPK